MSVPSMPAPPDVRDPFNFVFITMILFGITCLAPWNFFITADDYWKYKFRNVTANESTEKNDLQAVFTSYLVIASKVPFIFSLVLNTYLSKRLQTINRIKWPLLTCILLFVTTAVLVEVNTDQHQMEFLGGTLAIVVLIHLCCGFLQGGGTGLAGCFPSRYIGANVYGQAVGGVFATVAQVLCLMGNVLPTTSALLYFILAILILIVTQICFAVLVKTDFYKHYISTQTVAYMDLENTCEEEQETVSLWQIFKGGWIYFVSIIVIFWVTLSVFPAITVLVVSTHADGGSPLANKFFIPLACFMVYNGCDLIGRIIAAYLLMPPTWKKTIFASCLARVVFIPLFLLCNAHPRHNLPVVFDSDVAYIVFLSLLGITNGYLANITLTYSAKSAVTEHQETAGSMAAVFLGLGLMLGSVSSYATVKLL